MKLSSGTENISFINSFAVVGRSFVVRLELSSSLYCECSHHEFKTIVDVAAMLGCYIYNFKLIHKLNEKLIKFHIFFPSTLFHDARFVSFISFFFSIWNFQNAYHAEKILKIGISNFTFKTIIIICRYFLYDLSWIIPRPHHNRSTLCKAHSS